MISVGDCREPTFQSVEVLSLVAIYLATSVAVWRDDRRLKTQARTVDLGGPAAVFIGSVLLWILVVPVYFYQRRRIWQLAPNVLLPQWFPWAVIPTLFLLPPILAYVYNYLRLPVFV